MSNQAVESRIEHMAAAIRCDATDDFHIKRCGCYMPDRISQVSYQACDSVLHIQYWLSAVSMNRHVHLAGHYGYSQLRTRAVMMIDDNFIRFTNAPAVALRVNPSGEKINARAGSLLLLQCSPPAMKSMTLGSSLGSIYSGQQVVFAVKSRPWAQHGRSLRGLGCQTAVGVLVAGLRPVHIATDPSVRAMPTRAPGMASRPPIKAPGSCPARK
jgi:hypothetical protein